MAKKTTDGSINGQPFDAERLLEEFLAADERCDKVLSGYLRGVAYELEEHALKYETNKPRKFDTTPIFKLSRDLKAIAESLLEEENLRCS